MQSPIYLLSAVGSLCAAYFLWTLGIRKFFLDMMRERIFELRFDLFRLGMNGELPFDDEAYRALETLLSGLLRFGHRISFLTFLLSAREISRAQKEKDYVNVAAQISLKVSRLQPEAQKKILEILKGAHSAVIGYMVLSSLLLVSLFFVMKTLELFGLVHLEGTKDNVREAIEREVYIAESRRGMRLATA
jgi:hypothetical protein